MFTEISKVFIDSSLTRKNTQNYKESGLILIVNLRNNLKNKHNYILYISYRRHKEDANHAKSNSIVYTDRLNSVSGPAPSYLGWREIQMR